MQDRAPFTFVTASYLVVIRRERANSLADLAAALPQCSDATLFHHAFHQVEPHYYMRFSNDFAHWVLTACQQPALAEQLAAIDIRQMSSFPALRAALRGPIDARVAELGDAAHRPAFEPFYFCERNSVEVPLGTQAATLRELAEGIRLLDTQTVHHHFVHSRIRLQLATNDFCAWIERALGLSGLARRLANIDIAMKPLEPLRREILAVIRSEGAA
ncbi:MAG TPA: DUF5752 family protein [Vicinamibacterales bacterium]|nr:DUF5752 family protein [Vicinamibacterales bacterium]